MRRAIDYELVDFEQGFAELPKTHLRGHQGAAKQGSQPDPIINLGGVIPGFRIVLFPDRKGNILELMEGYRTRNDDVATTKLVTCFSKGFLGKMRP